MKQYADPAMELVRFDVTDATNFEGGENEVSAGSLFPIISTGV